MIKFAAFNFCIFLLLLLASIEPERAQAATNHPHKIHAQKSTASSDDKEKFAVSETIRIVAEIIKDSYPELVDAKISAKIFHSASDYFRSRFSFERFLTFRRLHYIIFVNPRVFGNDAPVEGIRSIIAHELAHADFYRRRNRLKLFGLIGLEFKSYTARFERGADLQAIKRGYGAGLKEYREWLYPNIPASKITAKKRNYFSPEEIDAILAATKLTPELIDYWIKKVPRNLSEIQASIRNQTGSGK